VHVPPKPGGKIGLLDTASSVFLFLAVGHLFFTKDEPAWVLLLISSVSLAIGLAFFVLRQRQQPDDGFLAITLFTLGRLFRKPEQAESADGAEKPPLARNWFWAPAVERYGLEAAEGPVAVFKIVTIFFFVSVFWALFDQHSSTWIRQAGMMDLTVWGETKVLPTQVPALNPLMVMILIPVMNLVYSFFDRRGIQTTPIRRITVGLLLAAVSFAFVAWLQQRIDDAGAGKVWFAWQIVPYLIMTVAEVMVSITGLEFAYTQAPKRMKSTIMGFWLLSVALGNVLVAILAGMKDLPLADFFWIWTGIMAASAVLFGVRGWFYVARDYPQE
jgi:POT family proton-dependent oligopeptide transporter